MEGKLGQNRQPKGTANGARNKTNKHGAGRYATAIAAEPKQKLKVWVSSSRGELREKTSSKVPQRQAWIKLITFISFLCRDGMC